MTQPAYHTIIALLILAAAGAGCGESKGGSENPRDDLASASNLVASTAADEDYERGVKLASVGRYSEAANAYAKAVARDFAPAQCELGFLYAEGFGVPRDDRKATGLFRQAAIQGNAKAQFNLAFMIQNDRAIARSIMVDRQTYEEMLVWYRKAAAQEYQPALNNLASILEDDPRYRNEAMQWRNDSVEEAERWRKAYMQLPIAPRGASGGATWDEDTPDVDAEIERCKSYVDGRGDLDSASECFLHLYSLGVIRARHYLDQIAARYNLTGQLHHAAGKLDLAESDNLKSVNLYGALGDVAGAGPVYASLAAIAKRLDDRTRMCEYAYRSRDLLAAAADNPSMLEDANRFIEQNCR